MRANSQAAVPPGLSALYLPQMTRRGIPIPVALIACLYLAVGVGAFIAHLKDLRGPDGPWIEATEFLAMVCGAFLLRGRNWARWLAVCWMAFHVAISIGVLQRLVLHSLFLAVIVWSLFRADSALYFKSKPNS